MTDATVIDHTKSTDSKNTVVSRWIQLVKEKDKRVFSITYCILFAIMFACMYSVFFLRGVNFIWIDDGLTQQYTGFIELGDWIRSFLTSIFVTHSFEIPLWSQELGYGQDYFLWISSFLGNPINWIAVFSNAENAEFLLNLTVPITLFLGGIAFCRLAFYHGNDGFSTLIGSMAYVFSGVSIIAFNQIFMLYPLLLAPLLILGVDKVFDAKSPVMLVVSVALFGFYSFVTLWMACLLLLLYCIIRYIFMDHKSPRLFFTLLARVLIPLLIGIAISGLFLIPNVACILSLDRVGLERSWNLFYPLTFYIEAIQGFIAFSYVGSECFFGFLTLSVLAIFALCVEKKDKTGLMLTVMLVVLTAMLLLPAFGRVMNGFAYPNNRWTWMFALLAGYITTYMTPRFLNGIMSLKRIQVFAICAIAFFMLFGALAAKAYYVPLILLMLLFAFLIYAKGTLLHVGLVVSLIISCGALFGLWGKNAAVRNVPQGEAYEMSLSGANRAVAMLEGDAWRFDALGSTQGYRNTSCVVDKNGTSLYNSLYNGYLDDYQSQLGLTTAPLNFSTTSLDGRSIMEQMANVKYVVVGKGEEHLVPDLYSVENPVDDALGMDVYSSDVQMPIASLFTEVIPESQFRSLNPIDAQEALLQGVVLDEGDASHDKAEIVNMNEALPFTYHLESRKDVVRTDAGAAQSDPVLESTPLGEGSAERGIVNDLSFSTEKEVSIHLDVSIPANTEAYVVLEGVDYQSAPALTARSSMVENVATKLKDVFPLSDNGCTITAAVSDRSTGVWQTGKDAHLYSGKNTWAFNLGLSDTERHGVDINFIGAGAYSIKSLEVCAEDTQKVKEAIKAMDAHAASDVSFIGNTFACNVDAQSDDDILLVRLPYSSGWKATIDGAPSETFVADLGFIGLDVPQGSHRIQLTYETPGLKAGAILSTLGVLSFIALCVVRRTMNRTQKEG